MMEINATPQISLNLPRTIVVIASRLIIKQMVYIHQSSQVHFMAFNLSF
jgi:hypothetical protein